ncbi:MAG: hypothetical protein QW331_01035 [Candidatus Woesearchaeota archaeon]
MIIEVAKDPNLLPKAEEHISGVIAERYKNFPKQERPKIIKTEGGVAVVYSLVGPTHILSESDFEGVPGRMIVKRLSSSFRSLEKYQVSPSGERIERPDIEVKIGNETMGYRAIKKGSFVLIAGPCAVEEEVTVNGKKMSGLDYTIKVAVEIAEVTKKFGLYEHTVLRGCPWKPRTNAYTWPGIGEIGLEYMDKAREASGLPWLCEALSENHVLQIAQHADGMWIGARTSTSQALVEAVARSWKPWGHKNHLYPGMDLADQLAVMEYGARINDRCFVIERGTQSLAKGDFSRNLPNMQKANENLYLVKSRAPVIIDPSHAVAQPEAIPGTSISAIADFNFDGLMIDVGLDNPTRKTFRCDGEQFLEMKTFEELVEDLVEILQEQGKI